VPIMQMTNSLSSLRTLSVVMRLYASSEASKKLLFQRREEDKGLAILCQPLSFSRVRQVRDLMPTLSLIAE
jgi:hypothetical protein